MLLALLLAVTYAEKQQQGPLLSKKVLFFFAEDEGQYWMPFIGSLERIYGRRAYASTNTPVMSFRPVPSSHSALCAAFSVVSFPSIRVIKGYDYDTQTTDVQSYQGEFTLASVGLYLDTMCPMSVEEIEDLEIISLANSLKDPLNPAAAKGGDGAALAGDGDDDDEEELVTVEAFSSTERVQRRQPPLEMPADRIEILTEDDL